MNHGELLNHRGELLEKGYATSLVRNYNRSSIKANKLRMKEWDYYLIYNSDYAVALTLDDNSYMGLVSASFIDFTKKKEKTTSIITAMPLGKTNFPMTSELGDVSIKNKKAEATFSNDGHSRKLNMKIHNFDQGEPIQIALELDEEPEDSMVIATPFPQNRKAFYYNQKIIGMRAKGIVEVHGNVYRFDRDNTFGLLDWGRGVWTYSNTWYWGAGQGLVDGEVFGFNIGYGFGDTSAATENMLFYKGKAHKLEGVTFHIPLTENGKEEYLKPWTFTSTDKRFEMNFTPIIDRNAYTSALVILSDQHQVFGYFNGTAVLDDGTKIELHNFLGFAEKVKNKW